MRRMVIIGALFSGLLGCGDNVGGDCAVSVGTKEQLAPDVGISWPIAVGATSLRVEGSPVDAAITVNLQRSDASVVASYPLAGLPSAELPITGDTWAVQVYNTGTAPLMQHEVIFTRPCGE